MAEPGANPARILVVDDESMVRRLLQRLLEREGYEVDLAASGEEAMERVQARVPDAVLLDMYMPGMDGTEVCRALKREPATKEIPVLMLSGDDARESHAAGREAGASDFLSKPFEVGDVLRRLHHAIEAARA